MGDFKPPKIKFQVGKLQPNLLQFGAKSASSHPPTEAILSLLKHQPYSCKLEIFFPVTDTGVGYKINDTMSPVIDHFLSTKCNSNQVLNSKFLETFLKQGEVYALSPFRRPLVDDCMAILPDGTFIASLTKDTFLESGLKQCSKLAQSRHHSLDIFESNLKLQSKDTGSNFTKNERNLPPFISDCHFLLSCEHVEQIDGKWCLKSKSDSVEFSSPVSKLLFATERKTLKNLFVPIIDCEKLFLAEKSESNLNASKSQQNPKPRSHKFLIDEDEDNSGFEIEKNASLANLEGQALNENFLLEIEEWIGSLHNRLRNYIEQSQPTNPEVSLMVPSKESVSFAAMHGLVFDRQGFLSSNSLLQQLIAAKSIVDQQITPYCIFSAWGFDNDPTRHCPTNRNAFLTILLLQDDYYLTISPQV